MSHPPAFPDPHAVVTRRRRRRHVRLPEPFFTRSLFPHAAYLSSSDMSTVEERRSAKKWSSEAATRHSENKSACCLPARPHFILNSRRLACFNDFQSQFVVVVGTTPHTPVVSTAGSSACSTCSSVGPASNVSLRHSV